MTEATTSSAPPGDTLAGVVVAATTNDGAGVALGDAVAVGDAVIAGADVEGADVAVGAPLAVGAGLMGAVAPGDDAGGVAVPGALGAGVTGGALVGGTPLAAGVGAGVLAGAAIAVVTAKVRAGSFDPRSVFHPGENTRRATPYVPSAALVGTCHVTG